MRADPQGSPEGWLGETCWSFLPQKRGGEGGNRWHRWGPPTCRSQTVCTGGPDQLWVKEEYRSDGGAKTNTQMIIINLIFEYMDVPEQFSGSAVTSSEVVWGSGGNGGGGVGVLFLRTFLIRFIPPFSFNS